jgi:hypothetical protein
MTTRLARLYGGLFLIDQAIGVLTAVVALAAPNIYLYWIHSIDASVAGTAMIALSILWPIYVWKARQPLVLCVLTAYHIGGLLLMEWLVRADAARVAASAWFTAADQAASTAYFAALQNTDITLVSLGHSAIGLICGVQLLLVVTTQRGLPSTASAPVQGQRPAR